MKRQEPPPEVGQVWELQSGRQRGRLIEITRIHGDFVDARVLYSPRVRKAKPTARLAVRSLYTVYAKADE